MIFDWDRTLCTTKSGAMPVVGKHSLEPELATLLGAEDGPPVCVATRNSHGAEISLFLAAELGASSRAVRTAPCRPLPLCFVCI